MTPEYTVEAADGFYIARNGEGVLDLADPQDYEFAEFVCAALNQAAQQSVQPTIESGRVLPAKKSNRKGSAPAKSG